MADSAAIFDFPSFFDDDDGLDLVFPLQDDPTAVFTSQNAIHAPVSGRFNIALYTS